MTRRPGGTRGAPLARRERGAATPLVAISLVVLFVATAFTVDLGRLSERRRSLQLVADVAALDAARALTDAPAALQYTAVRDAAQRSADRNAGEAGGAAIDVVLLSADGDELDETATAVPSAVSVRAQDHVRFLFQPGGKTATARATAKPASEPTAQLTLGSGLLSLGATPEGVAQGNAVNSGLLGRAVSLDALSYQGLASTSLTLGDLALAAGLGNDVDALLSSELSIAEVYELAMDVLVARDDTGPALLALGALSDAAATSPVLSPIRLGDLVVVDPDTPLASYASLDLTLDRLVQGTLLLGNEGSIVSIPSMYSSIPGLTSLAVQMAIGEPARIVVGPAGTTVESAQVRLGITFDVQVVGQPLVHLPLVIEAAAARATIIDLVCAGQTPVGAAVEVATTGASVAIGHVNDLAADGDPTVEPAVIAPLDLLDVTVAASIPVASQHGTVNFGVHDWGTAARVGGPLSIGRSQITAGISVAGAPIDLGLLDAVVISLLDGVVVPSVNVALTMIVEPLLDLVGAQLAYADVTVSDPLCNSTTPRLIA